MRINDASYILPRVSKCNLPKCTFKLCGCYIISLLILSLTPFIMHTVLNYLPYNQLYQTKSPINAYNLAHNRDYISYSWPQTYVALNKELFCPTSMSDGYENLIKHIYELQYVKNCTDQNQKFYIAEHQCGVGLFASLECIIFYWTQAILSNRTFLLKGIWTFSSDKDMQKYNCLSNSMDCYFLPLSNCNVDDVLKHENNKSNPSIVYLSPENINHMDTKIQRSTSKWIYEYPGQALKFFTERIIYQPVTPGYRRIGPKRTFDKNLRNFYGHAIQRRTFTAVLESYLLRMKPDIKLIVNDIVHNSFNTNINNENVSNYIYNVNNSVSILIRWSDKCRNKELKNKHYPHPEMECYTYDEYMKLIKTLKISKPNLEYVIVTCDSPDIIDNITMEYKDWMIENNMKFVTNIGDIMQESSTIDRFATSNNALLILLSMLSTMRIQFASKYYFLQTRSFWNVGIFNLVNTLMCQPLTEYELGYNYESKLKFENINVDNRVKILLSGNVGNRVVDTKLLGELSNSNFTKTLNEDYIKIKSS